jgi:hypothetical protein
LREAAQSHLSKVADGKRTTGYADEDFIRDYGNKQATQKKNEAVCKTREIKLDTTNIVERPC